MTARCAPLSLLTAALLALTAALSVSAQALSANSAAAALPDAPQPAGAISAGESSSTANVAPFLTASLDPALTDGGFLGGVTPRSAERVPLAQCPFDRTGASECRVHWHQLLIEASIYDAFQNAGNLYTGYWYRWETMNGKWLDRYFDSVLGWRWDTWQDNNPLLDDYVGHPMMGSITNYLWIQNDPRGMTLEFSNTRPYWHSRLRAMAFSTAFSLQWKFGPFGEAAVGHNGDHYFVDKGVRTNETGWVELVTTPVGGLGWTVLEDIIDKHLRSFEQRPHRLITRIGVGFLTPSRSTANFLRFRAPWYRDGYVVKADTYWSDPPGTDAPANAPGDQNYALTEGSPAAGTVRPSAPRLPEWPHYGGINEVGAWWGLSMTSGKLWGSEDDVYYMPMEVTYSHLLNPQGHGVALRYAPELTALAMLDEAVPGKTDRFGHRKRSYGAGLSPAGMSLSFGPDHRVQPFVTAHAGFLAFTEPVLRPDPSQVLSTVDFGGGLTVFHRARQSMSFGYRYQHLGGIGGSSSTDANTFYFQISRYRTGGYR